jgi:hypothetical protein
VSDLNRSAKKMLPEYPSRERKLMPAWARVVAAVMGIVLFPLGMVALFAMRPLDLKTVVVAGGVTCAGLDLVTGAYSGKWPFSLQWMPFL